MGAEKELNKPSRSGNACEIEARCGKNNADMICTIMPNRLAMATGSKAELVALKRQLDPRKYALVSSEYHHCYEPFAADFGPVNISVVHRFCLSFMKRLNKDDGRILVYCIEDNFAAQANASFLLGALLVLKYGWSAARAAEPFIGVDAPFKLPLFRDATFQKHGLGLCLSKCLKGLSGSVQLGWFDTESFSATRYEQLDGPENGDVHQLCPKLVGFKGPLAQNSHHRKIGEIVQPPEHYISIFEDLGVSCVVRLNDPDTYDPAVFERAGISHHDLFFNDCTVPPDSVVERFLDICDSAPGAVAVHCRAGLGRTGTLAALWLMKRAGFGAEEAIGWLRLVRPGSVIGPQHGYLKACERRGWRGNALAPAVQGSRLEPGASTSLPAAALHSAAAVASAESDAAAASKLAKQVTESMCARGMVKAASANELALAGLAGRPAWRGPGGSRPESGRLA